MAAGVTVFEDMGRHVEQVGGDQLAFVRDGLEMIRLAVHETANYGYLTNGKINWTPAWSSRPAPAIARSTMSMRARKLAYMEAWHRHG